MLRALNLEGRKALCPLAWEEVRRRCGGLIKDKGWDATALAWHQVAKALEKEGWEYNSNDGLWCCREQRKSPPLYGENIFPIRTESATTPTVQTNLKGTNPFVNSSVPSSPKIPARLYPSTQSAADIGASAQPFHPAQPIPMSQGPAGWTCIYGQQNPDWAEYCAVCGRPRPEHLEQPVKVVNDPTMQEVCSELQVSLYPTGWDEPLPGTMEEIKISIVNDQATGSKRERDEATDLSPCAKRSRHEAFSCSTPSSARTWATHHQYFPALYSQCEVTGEDEMDDSILGSTDDENDFDPSSLSEDQIDSMLQPVDNDSCHAAESLEKFNEVTTCARPSESEGQNSEVSLYKTLDVLGASDTLTEEPESEGELSNYAAMPPSPCQSALDHVEVGEPIQSSVCNVKSPNELPTGKTAIDNDLSTPLLDIKEVSSSQTPDSLSPQLLVQTSISLSRVDAALDRSEVPDFAFDYDDVLTISPEVPFSSDEDDGVELVTGTHKGKSSGTSDSTVAPQDTEVNQVLTVNAACCSTSGAAQHYSPLSLNTADMSKDSHYHPTAKPEPSKVPSTSSPVVSVEPKLSIGSLGTGKTVEFKKPSKIEESKAVQNEESSSSLTNPTPSAAPTANGIGSKIVAPSCCKVQGPTDPRKESARIATVPVCRPSFRAFLSDIALEIDKNFYCSHVLMHLNSQRECTLEDPVNELSSLLKQISQDNQNWQHPSDLSKRNHPRFGMKPSRRCTLNQWAAQNGGTNERFKDFPNTFQRSPIPSVLPFSFS